MKTGCIYIRTATIEENYKNVHEQLTLLMNVASRKKINVKQIFIDAGISSYSKIKPQQKIMMNYIEDNTLDYVLVRDIERISSDYRDVQQFIDESYTQLLTTRGVVKQSLLKILIDLQTFNY